MKLTIKYCAIFLLSIFITLLAVGCSEKQVVQGSCDAGMVDDKSRICVDYYFIDDLNQWRNACASVMKGKWSESACNTNNVLGGCEPKNHKAITWIYTSEKHQTKHDVEKFCSNKSQNFVLPAN